MPTIEFEHVTRAWGPIRVLEDVSASFTQGEVNGLVGPSGAGKTTLLRILAGLDASYDGVLRFPSEWRQRAGQVGVVFQGLSLWPHVSVRGHVEYVLHDVPRESRRGQAEAILREVGLDESKWDHRPSQLSGGESQRLALARALAPAPQLLLLDEPFAQLDFPVRQTLLQQLREIVAEREMTVVLVTHSWLELIHLCTRVVALVAGRVVQQGRLEAVFAQPVSDQVAVLVGPIVRLPQTHFDARRMTMHEAAPIGQYEGTLWFRPQQLEVRAESQGAWRVRECRLGPFRYDVVLECGEEWVELPSAGHFAVGTRVEVAVHSLPESGAHLGSNGQQPGLAVSQVTGFFTTPAGLPQ